MIDLHTHTFFSDGELVPSELARRAEMIGYQALAITDHADTSNFDFIIPRIVSACAAINKRSALKAIPGIEITHVHPADIRPLAAASRKLGAKLIVVHGETITEPVMPGTNRKALTADIDILAHPGLITETEVKRAAEKGIHLEITARKGHSLTNGHVARLAKKYRARMVINTDAHGPADLISMEDAEKVILGAGLNRSDGKTIFANSRAIVRKLF